MTTHTTRIYRHRADNGGETEVVKERVEKDDTVVYHRQNAAPETNVVSRVLYYLLDVLEVLLALRLIFMLLAANSANAFVSFIYNVTAPFVAPFRGIIPASYAGGMYIEWSAVIAMIVYALAVYAVARLIEIATQRSYQAQ